METRPQEGTTFEPMLLITLGPPPDGWQRDLFDEFQRRRKDGDWSGTSRWERFEGELIEKVLFGREGDGRSGVEEFLFGMLGMDCHVSKHEGGYGVYRGLWVAHIFIPMSGVHQKDGGTVAWPPGKSERDVVGAALGLTFRREWIFMAALTPGRTGRGPL